MNFIAVANETKKIIKERKYICNGEEINLPDMDYEDVLIYSPEKGERLIEWHLSNDISNPSHSCKISVIAADSYQAAKQFDNPLVMNFANAHKPGGGFEFGATAQEESLCRCSTLFASISSKKAKEMYSYNNRHTSAVESDYMLISKVCVFRDAKCEFIKEPFTVGVVTVPAPNRNGLAALTPEPKLEEAMVKRIRIMLLAAAENGYRSLVLGAWGCGAFRHDPANVSGYFKQVLIDEHYVKYFDDVCFAIYGREDGRNITAFRKCFEDFL